MEDLEMMKRYYPNLEVKCSFGFHTENNANYGIYFCRSNNQYLCFVKKFSGEIEIKNLRLFSKLANFVTKRINNENR